MAAKNKARGNAAERAFVQVAEQMGIKAVRAWGSDGRSMGHHEEVDVLLDGHIKVQVKRRKSIADYVLPNENVDIQALYQDGNGGKRKRMPVVLPVEEYYRLLNVEKELEYLKSRQPEDWELGS